MQTDSLSLVSVIVRTKDRPELLKHALRSVSAQTYRPLELVLVNDGGCDLDLAEITEILGNVSLRYLRLETNKGRAYAGNAGIKGSAGAHIVFLDDDDILYPPHISVLRTSPQAGGAAVVYSDAYLAHLDIRPGLPDVTVKDKQIFSSTDFSFSRLLDDNFIPLMTILFPAHLLRECGGFDEQFELFEDWDMLIRLAVSSPFFHIPEATAEYRQWSETEQIAQTKAFREKAAGFHDQVTLKHAKLYRAEMVRCLRQKEQEQETKKPGQDLLQAQLQGEKERAAELEKTNAELQLDLQEKEKALANIRNSHGWNFLLRYYKARDLLFPPASRRRTLLGKILRTERGEQDR
ncbi:MAG: hypothetical protein C0402_15090 [Thermodesulfovibrio sp.]|nr:hypothetical protein [Thermodesulfovibrio sp.]